MVAWGLVAQVLGQRIGRASIGSIASIPYMAAVFLVPRAETALCVAASEAIVGLVRRQDATKLVFNVAQTAVSVAITALLYLALGGTSLLGPESPNYFAYVAAVFAFWSINSLCVSAVIAISESRAVLPVWYANTKSTIVNNLLATPLPFLFAQLFVSKGAFGALLLVVPVLAVRQVYRTAWQLETATQDLLQLMVKAIEARDPYTSGHSQRVQEYAVQIGRAIGLSTRSSERLSRAALLHDVGKIHEIYAPILRKPDKLTTAEWALMKTHPVKSAELVATVSHLRDIVPSIRHHHENWNGTGYPDRLQGAAIPLYARIIALADTIDAMTTDRPYRRALSADKVREEIGNMAGVQFDPDICEAILVDAQFDRLRATIARNSSAPVILREGVRRAV